jgi:hypothetical protein
MKSALSSGKSSSKPLLSGVADLGVSAFLAARGVLGVAFFLKEVLWMLSSEDTFLRLLALGVVLGVVVSPAHFISTLHVPTSKSTANPSRVY